MRRTKDELMRDAEHMMPELKGALLKLDREYRANADLRRKLEEAQGRLLAIMIACEDPRLMDKNSVASFASYIFDLAECDNPCIADLHRKLVEAMYKSAREHCGNRLCSEVYPESGSCHDWEPVPEEVECTLENCPMFRAALAAAKPTTNTVKGTR